MKDAKAVGCKANGSPRLIATLHGLTFLNLRWEFTDEVHTSSGIKPISKQHFVQAQVVGNIEDRAGFLNIRHGSSLASTNIHLA